MLCDSIKCLHLIATYFESIKSEDRSSKKKKNAIKLKYLIKYGK